DDFWSLRHYVGWVIKNESELPTWRACIKDFYDSLDWIIERRSLPRSIRAVAKRLYNDKEIPETQTIIKELEIPYKKAYNGKYGASIYKTVVHVQEEENVFASASQTKTKNSKKHKVQDEDQCFSAKNQSSNPNIRYKDQYRILVVKIRVFLQMRRNGQHFSGIRSFASSKKWMLKSGRFVEDVPFRLGMECRYHNLVHSFILDPEDTFVKNAFSKEEMDEILNKSVQDPPEIEDEVLKYLNTFSKILCTDLHQEIRKALNTSHPRLGGNFNPQVDFAFDHIRTTVADWLCLLEMQPNPLTLDMPEAWYRINVWWTIDIAFSDIPYTYVIGGEKADAYVRTIGTRSTDWAASEASSKWQGIHDTKIMKDSGLSLPRTLKDIFIHLAGKINYSEPKLQKLVIVGFIHAGSVLIRTNLDCPAGYFYRYTRGNPLEVYMNVKEFGKTLDVLVEIIYAKLLIFQTMQIVNNPTDIEIILKDGNNKLIQN
ncbi:41550_t:CDS:10, partial [Gigaspora margarita]